MWKWLVFLLLGRVAGLVLWAHNATTRRNSANTTDSELNQLQRTRVFASPSGGVGASLVSQNSSRTPRTVWVVGLPRSGTSLLQKVVAFAAAGQDVPVFAIFEPCHSKDRFKGRTIGRDVSVAAECLRRALACDFDDIDTHKNLPSSSRILHGTTGAAWPSFYSGLQISAMCSSSEIRVFKTIYPAPTGLTEISEYIDGGIEGLKLIQITRDPRAIYASLLRQSRSDSFTWVDGETPTIICERMLEWAHDVEKYGGRLGALSMFQVSFERLVTQSAQVDEVLDFLSWPYSATLHEFLQMHLSASSCPATKKPEDYTECRTAAQTEEVLTKWRHTLDTHSLEKFETSTCRQIVPLFGYAD